MQLNQMKVRDEGGSIQIRGGASIEADYDAQRSNYPDGYED